MINLRTASAASTGTLVVGDVGAPISSFFPTALAANSLGSTYAETPYLLAYRLNLDGLVLPDATNVPVAVPGTNSTQWVVNLRTPGEEWSDGVAMNSTDLAFSYGLWLPTGPYANMSTVDTYGEYQGIVSNVKIDNSTAITITTSSPRPLFPIQSALTYILPWHYYKQFTGNNVLQTTPIFGGPGDSAYIPQGYTAGSNTIDLVPNPHSISWNGATPTISQVIVQLFASDTALVNALAAGTVDTGVVQNSDLAALKASSSITVATVPSNVQLFQYVRSTGYPWNVTAFRQAMLTLMPKSMIASTLYNNSVSTGNPDALLPGALSTYWPGPNTPTYNYSTTQAVSLLKQAGLTENSAGKWIMPNGTALSITIQADSADTLIVRTAQFEQTAMQGVGLTVNLQTVSDTSANSAWSTGAFQILLYVNNPAPTPFKFFRNPANFPGWTNSTFRADYNKAASDSNPTTSLAELKQAALILAQSAVVNGVVILPSYVAYDNKDFTNWQPALNQSPNLDAFWQPVYAENVLTSVQPVAGASSSSSVSTTSTSNSQTSTSTTSSSSLSLSPYIGLALIMVSAVLALGLYGSRRISVRPYKGYQFLEQP